jgi:hypothetical protein
LDLTCENEDVLHRVKQKKNIVHNMKRRKPNWIYIFCVETASKHVSEDTGGGRRRGGRRRKVQPDDLKDRKRYQYFKEEELDSSIWRTRFGRGCGPAAKQTTKLTNWNKQFSN